MPLLFLSLVVVHCSTGLTAKPLAHSLLFEGISTPIARPVLKGNLADSVLCPAAFLGAIFLSQILGLKWDMAMFASPALRRVYAPLGFVICGHKASPLIGSITRFLRIPAIP